MGHSQTAALLAAITAPEPPDPADADARAFEQEQLGAKEYARIWLVENAEDRNRLSLRIEAYLRSADGRLGEFHYGISEILTDPQAGETRYQRLCWKETVKACCDRLVKARAIRRDELGRYWNPKAYYAAHQSSKKRSGAVQNIGTVPDAVRLHPAITPARLAVAVALSSHLYATRRSWAKARAIGTRRIAEAANINRETALSALDWLTKQGLLDYDQAAGSRGRVYCWTAKTKTFGTRPRKR